MLTESSSSSATSADVIYLKMLEQCRENKQILRNSTSELVTCDASKKDYIRKSYYIDVLRVLLGFPTHAQRSACQMLSNAFLKSLNALRNSVHIASNSWLSL